jgi:hypothetical protein
MQHHVIIAFGRDKEFEFKLIGGAPADEARAILASALAH